MSVVREPCSNNVFGFVHFMHSMATLAKYWAQLDGGGIRSHAVCLATLCLLQRAWPLCASMLLLSSTHRHKFRRLLHPDM
jgi:hypothetical protein